MATFSIEIKAYEIVTCTQVQTVAFFRPTTINIDAKGNGKISLAAENVDMAMNKAQEQLEVYRNGADVD